MNTEVPYMPAVGNLHKILDSIQNAGAPDAFGLDFLRDLGYTSSNDRAVIKLLKYLGFLDSSGKPQPSYRDFMDGSRAKSVLAKRMRTAYDDLFLADKGANNHTVERLKGWFKTKTGEGEAVAKKMATTFKSLASYANWDGQDFGEQVSTAEDVSDHQPDETDGDASARLPPLAAGVYAPPPTPPSEHRAPLFTYRIEINLPDTTNIETYRAIFRAVKEELAI